MPTCPHCQAPIGHVAANSDKVKLATRIVVLHKSGDVEINCGRCKRGVIIGSMTATALRKAAPPRLVIRERA
jgi:hypothetical protein